MINQTGTRMVEDGDTKIEIHTDANGELETISQFSQAL